MVVLTATSATSGDADWSAAQGSSSPTTVYYVDGNVSPALTSPNGSINAPFATIQAALDAMGTPTTTLDGIITYVIQVAPGIYDEDLTIPSFRSVVIRTDGIVSIGTPGSTIRNVTLAVAGAPPAGISSQVLGLESSAGPAQFLVTGRVILTSTAATRTNFYATNIVVQGGTTGSGFDAVGYTGGGEVRMYCDTCTFFTQDADATPSVAGGDPLKIYSWRNCTTESGAAAGTAVAISAGEYGLFSECYFDGDVVFATAGGATLSGSRVVGFFSCDWDLTSDFDGTAAGDFALDAASNFNFKAAGGAVVGPSTKTVLADVAP